MNAYMYICMYLYVCMYVYMHVGMHVYMCMYACISVCVCVCVFCISTIFLGSCLVFLFNNVVFSKYDCCIDDINFF